MARPNLKRQIAESKLAFLRSAGALLHLAALVALIGLVPYSMFAAYQLYLAFSTVAGSPIGSLLYAIARCGSCILLIYALWRLRGIGLRLRNLNMPLTPRRS